MVELGKRANLEEAPNPEKRVKTEEPYALRLLPSATCYEKSYMHKDCLSFVSVAAKTDFVITASQDGYVKFWRKVVQGIEFVKTFRAHLQAISSVALNRAEDRYATSCAPEQCIKIFDVVNFDLINMLKLAFSPELITFTYRQGEFQPLLAVASGPSIKIVRTEHALADKRNEQSQYVLRSKDLHEDGCQILAFNSEGQYGLSIGKDGVPDLWDPETLEPPT